MARIPVGGTATVDQLGKVATPGASAVLYLTRLGGTPIADVIDEAGAAIPGGIITIPADGIFPLVRPEVGALTSVWVSVNGGPRQWLPAHNLGAGASQADPGADIAAVGPNLITGTGWTLGPGWSGDFATGFTYTHGGTYGPLTWTPPFATGNNVYLVEFTVDSPTDSSNFTVTLGGSFGMVMYEGAVGGTWTYRRGIRSVTSGDLVFTPADGFSGSTVRNVSVKAIGEPAPAPFAWRDSDGVTTVEMRPTKGALSNVFIGKDAGRFNVSGKENAVFGNRAMRDNVSGFWNAVVGDQAMEQNVNGTRNAALGVYALQYNVDGHRNIAIGPFALRGNTHGKGNIGLGADVMWFNETGDYNIALGQAALGEMHDGDSNIAIGRAALAYLDNHSDSIAIGDYALAFWPGGSQPNIAIGQDALRNAQAGAVSNTAMGNLSMQNVTTATDNVAIGNRTLDSLTDNGFCVAVGSWSGRNLTGQRNTAIGSYACQGQEGSTGQRNTGLGYSALTSITSGNFNVAIGSSAGVTLTSASGNILIGDNVQGFSATEQDYLNIGNTIYGRMGSAKRIGIGVVDPKARMHLPASTSAASSAPLKLDPGTLMGVPEAGAIEFDGTDLYITTTTGVRKKVTAA